MSQTTAERSRKWRERHPERQRESIKKYYQSHREAILEEKKANREYYRNYYAQNFLTINGRKVKVNKRPKPLGCEICGKRANRMGYHHWDDEHPCLGLWLCHDCHKMAECIDRGYHIIYLREKKGMVLLPPT